MQIDRIADDISVVIGDTYHSASTVFVANDEALVVDGMGSTRDAESLRRYIEGDLRKQVRFLIATHYFSDHLAALRVFPSATIVAHELYAHTFATELHRSVEENAFFVKPAITFSDRMTLRWGSYTLRLFHNPGDSMSAIGIDVAEADLLFTADAVAGNLSYFAYSTPDLVLAAIDRLRQCGRSRILIGHGGPRDAIALDHARDYVLRLSAHAARCFASGTQSTLTNAPAEDFLPASVTPTETERTYHRRNLDYLLSKGSLLYA
ncbi:MAG: MBL fold metallo-hydrolase [Thermoanaerobaculia bacterium]